MLRGRGESIGCRRGSWTGRVRIRQRGRGRGRGYQQNTHELDLSKAEIEPANNQPRNISPAKDHIGLSRNGLLPTPVISTVLHECQKGIYVTKQAVKTHSKHDIKIQEQNPVSSQQQHVTTKPSSTRPKTTKYVDQKKSNNRSNEKGKHQKPPNEGTEVNEESWQEVSKKPSSKFEKKQKDKACKQNELSPKKIAPHETVKLSIGNKPEGDVQDVTKFTSPNNNWLNEEVVKYCSKHNVMFILRGLPGSGKSTVSQFISILHKDGHVVVCSADDFRINSAGEYIFDPNQLTKTHKQCQQKAELNCKQKKHVIVIDNTNIQQFEYDPYVSMANKNNYAVIFLSLKYDNVEQLSICNVHNVPRDKIRAMKSKFKEDPIPKYYNWSVPISESNRLKKEVGKIILNCSNNSELFQSLLHSTIKASAKTIFQTYNRKNCSTKHHFHVTTAFTYECNVPRKQSDIYTQSEIVKTALGSTTKLQVIGLVITSKIMAARVLLTDQQKALWGTDDALGEEKNPIAFESADVKQKRLAQLFKDLRLDKFVESESLFEPPHGCTQPSHQLGCTAHITLGTRGINKPVVAKDSMYQVVHLEENSMPLHEAKVPGNVSIRCYANDTWVVYFGKAIAINAMFCGQYGSEKDR